MNRLELVQRVCLDTGLKQSQVVEVMKSITFHCVDGLRNAETVALMGMGVMSLGRVGPKVIKNPRSGNFQSLPAKYIIRYKPTAAIKASVQ